MDSDTPEVSQEKTRLLSRPAARISLGVFNFLFFIAVFFYLAGGLDWLRGWIFLLIYYGGVSIHALYLKRRNPELSRRRAKIGKNTKKWDRVWLVLFYVLLFTVLYVGALDAGRYGWSRMQDGFWLVGLVLYSSCLVFLSWVMTVNPFFEKTVRIQHDRNHRVVDSGPYRLVRHPGYTAIIPGFILSAPLLLGSWWAMVPAVMTAAWLVLRTVLEDRTLRKELPGYEEYARRVRYRLIPFVW